MDDLLKEFWPIALFFAISIISYMRNETKVKQQKGDAQQPEPQMLDENFPEVEVFEYPSTHAAKPVNPRQTASKKPVNKEYEPAKGMIKSVESSRTSSAGPRAKVTLKGKSDVKKAFVYSEILNRKYK